MGEEAAPPAIVALHGATAALVAFPAMVRETSPICCAGGVGQDVDHRFARTAAYFAIDRPHLHRFRGTSPVAGDQRT
jgi:hypothetical protein